MASTSAEAVQWNDLAVKNSLRSQIATAQQGVNDGEDLLGVISTLGSALVNSGDDDKYAAVRHAAQRLLEARQRLDVHHEALGRVQASYRATGNATDFKSQLARHTEDIEEDRHYTVASDALLVRFDQEAGGADFQDEQIDDEIAIAGESAHQVGRNTNCPITLKPILELENPVADHKDFVYEKDAILQMLKGKGPQGIKCPVAGTTHVLTEADLRPATAVIAAKKKEARKGKRQQKEGKEVLELV